MCRRKTTLPFPVICEGSSVQCCAVLLHLLSPQDGIDDPAISFGDFLWDRVVLTFTLETQPKYLSFYLDDSAKMSVTFCFSSFSIHG